MNPRRKKRLTIVISILAGLGLVIGLLLYALSQNIDVFLNLLKSIKAKTIAALSH